MTIKDVEERTGLSRSNVRFYEKEKLVEPSRNESNGYRDYSENDVENIKKIAYLRTLGISIEDIRNIISEKVTLQEMLEKQKEVLKNQITDLNKAKLMCEKMLDEGSISYEKLQVEQYVTDFHDYWKDNRTVFKLDSVSFLYIWGSMLTWITITVLCLIIGALSYSKLPVKIPVQWSKGVATSLGVLIMINWQIGLICLIFALALMAVTKMVSLGSISAAILFPVLTLFIHSHYIVEGNGYFIFSIILAAIVCFNHRANIKRIMNGTENKLSFGKK